MRSSHSIYTILLFSFSVLLISSCSSERKKEVTTAQRGGGGPGGRGANRPTPRVDAFVVQTQVISESIEIPGSLVADESTEIHPEVSGRIIGLYVREGSYVSKGALLAKLYDADLQAQLRKVQVQLQIAQQTENRYNKPVFFNASTLLFTCNFS